MIYVINYMIYEIIILRNKDNLIIIVKYKDKQKRIEELVEVYSLFKIFYTTYFFIC